MAITMEKRNRFRRTFVHDESGQMTVELAVVLPVILIIAVIAVNALQFFSLCASFDRASHNEARIYGASPSYGMDKESVRAAVESALTTTFSDVENVDVTVGYSVAAVDLDRFEATLEYHPTLFGMGLRSEVFGVALPSLKHTSEIVIDCYKPGVFV